MQRLISQFRVWMFPLLLLGISLITFGLSHRSSEAQSTGTIRIGSVAMNAWTSSTATIAFTVNGVATGSNIEVQVQYGTSAQYGSSFPATTFAVVQPTDTITLTGLQSSTTYHYRLRIREVGSTTILDQSADRTFATKAGDQTAAPVIIVQGTDCSQTSCLISFTTSIPASVTLAWDTTFQSPGGEADFCTTYAHCVNEAAGSYLGVPRSLQMTGLSGTTTYHYRLMARAQNGNWSMTGNTSADLQLTTTNGGSDHTFTTGSCTEGTTSYPIGACLPSGMICTSNGPRQDCTASCGFTCPANSTCNASGSCLADPSIDDGNPTKCNQSSCYRADGSFLTPANANCYASWPRCTANTILKVERDRGCNLWLSCGTSIQTTPAKNLPAENLCLTLAACNQIGPDGQCAHYLPQGQCDNDPLRFCSNDNDCVAGGTCNAPPPDDPTRNLQNLTYATPAQIKQIAHLSGNVVAGLDWSNIGGATVIQGFLPWQLMRQIGGSVKLKNGDFETNAPNVAPWIAVPEGETPDDSLQADFEDQDNSINHVLKVTPVTQQVVTDAAGLESTQPVQFSGAASQEFTSSASEYYYAEARIRAPNGNPIVRFELGHNGFSQFTVSATASGTGQEQPTFVDTLAGSVWQRVIIGPIKGLSGGTRAAFVCADTTTCAEFWVDDVQIKPILQASTNPQFVSPSCRLYPKEDSPACDYTNESGVTFKGWHGYCLENDSQTGNCLSWWPVDIIKGESSIFGSETTAGYQDRSPLYFCAQSGGNNSSRFNNEPYTVYANHSFGSTSGASFSANSLSSNGVENISSNCNPAGDSCRSTIWDGNYSIGACSSGGSACQVPTGVTQADGQLVESQISKVRWVKVAGIVTSAGSETIEFDNTPGFQSSNGNSDETAWRHGDGEGNDTGPARIRWRMYREVSSDGKFIYWQYKNTLCEGGGLNGNCVSLALKFDAHTGKFLTYFLDVTDRTGSDPEMLAFQVVFTVKEMCQAVVQTVKANGENVAFANRVTTNNYLIDGLNYKRGTDFLPYGAIVTPETNTDNPERWPALTFETQSLQFSSPGQARAGSTYACVGDCAAAICHAADPSNAVEGRACTLPATSANTCSVDTDLDGKKDGICSGGVSGATTRGTQSFSSLQTSLTPSVTGAADSFFAQNRLQRLFAQSYGVWSNRRCVNYAGGGVGQLTTTACSSNADCLGQGYTNPSCDFQTSQYKQLENSDPEQVDDNQTLVGWRPPTTLCPVTTVSSPSSCSRQTISCTATTQITGPKADTINEAKDAAKAKCKTIVACDGSVAACTTQGVTGTSVKYDNFESTSCVTIRNANSNTLSYSCTGRCTASGQTYTNVVANSANAVTVTKRVRPAAPNDYCAIPPSATNFKFTNATSNVAVLSAGGGSVGISFNSNADAEQVPLQTILIDWGDSQDSYSYPFAPKSDPRTPHIFSHVYNYNRADNAHCTPGGSCIYNIKVQIKDNWGWCNEASGNIQCQSNPANWSSSGLKVVVNP